MLLGRYRLLREHAMKKRWQVRAIGMNARGEDTIPIGEPRRFYTRWGAQRDCRKMPPTMPMPGRPMWRYVIERTSK